MEESPHKCPVCSRSFNQRSNLKTHLLTHTERSFECLLCSQFFASYGELKNHETTLCQTLRGNQIGKTSRIIEQIPADSTCLDLTTRREDSKDDIKDQSAVKGSTHVKKPLGFSIEEIMKR